MCRISTSAAEGCPPRPRDADTWLTSAEVDDMAMLRLLAREREGVTLPPPIIVRHELESGVLVEHCRIPQLTESFYAIIQNRRFPNALLADLLTSYVGTAPNPVAS